MKEILDIILFHIGKYEVIYSFVYRIKKSGIDNIIKCHYIKVFKILYHLNLATALTVYYMLDMEASEPK